MNSLLLASVLLTGLFGSYSAVPVPPGPGPAPPAFHAFCRTMWLFPSTCVEISTTIVKQIQAFNPMNGCDQCQYRLVSVTPRSIKANHTSVDNLQAESLSFTFSPTVMTGSCRVAAQSTSLGFTNLIDNGLNYCNLYDLVSMSGLTSVPGFEELVNEWACLGYGLATCADN
uniref:Uncharacterized protein n=1 Tax=Cynoglossus semilaevis TaxID=244447 RepID=A0A3P8VTP1_CYNSE